MAQTIVVIGASRGIGLELARLWHERGERVMAVCRRASEELASLGVQVIEGIDVSAEDDVQRLRDRLGDTAIDMLYHSAGIMRDENLRDMNPDTIREQLDVNAVAPLRVVHALMDRLTSGAKVGLMTSRMGSIADNDSGGRYGYRMSKAALNAAGKSLAVDLASCGVAVAILHPGFVRTDMTNQNGHMGPQESARQLVQRMDELTLENTGKFWHANGTELPW